MTDTEKQFNEWLNSNASPYTFLDEYFHGDCEIEDVEIRIKMMKKWLLQAFKEGRNAFIEEAIPVVLYGDIDEVPFEIIKDHCKLNEKGEIDWYQINELDDEQQTRMAVAATLRSMRYD